MTGPTAPRPGRAPTMEDVARQAGVSRALVSIVYRGANGASDETRERVLEAGRRLGYRPNHLAGRLASKTVRSVGVMLFDMQNELTAEVFAGIQEEADRLDVSVVVGVSDPSGRRDSRTVNELLGIRVDALLMISATMSGARIRELHEAIPVVSITRRVNGVDSVVVDEAAAGRLLVDHLVEQGCRRIVQLAPPWRPSARVDGYTAAMQLRGLEPRVVEVGYEPDSARRAATDVLRAGNRPDALVANNDLAAFAVMDAARSIGLDVPADLAVVGFDNLQLSSLDALSVTSIDQRPRELGRVALTAALDRSAQRDLPPHARVLEPRLVVRRSSSRQVGGRALGAL